MARREERVSRLATATASSPHKKPTAPKIMASTGPPPRVPAVNPTSEVPATVAIAGIRGKVEDSPSRTGWGW